MIDEPKTDELKPTRRWVDVTGLPLVVLTIGGPLMQIVAVDFETHKVKCRWVNGSRVDYDIFPFAVLSKLIPFTLPEPVNGQP